MHARPAGATGLDVKQGGCPPASSLLTRKQQLHFWLAQLMSALQYRCQQALHIWCRLLRPLAALQQAILTQAHPPAAPSPAPPHQRHAALQLLLLLLLLLACRRGRRMLLVPAGLLASLASWSTLALCPISTALQCASIPGAAPHEALGICQPQRGSQRAVPAGGAIQPLPPLLLLAGPRWRLQLLLLEVARVDGQTRQQRLARGRSGGGQALQVGPGCLGVHEIPSDW